MNRGQRALHRRAWLIMLVILPAIFAFADWMRTRRIDALARQTAQGTP